MRGTVARTTVLGLLLLVSAAVSVSIAPLEAQEPEAVTDPVTLQRLGVLYLEENRPADAIRALRRAADYMPENGETHMWLGFAYFLNQDFDLAEESYLRALKHNPVLVDVHNYMGLLRAEQGEYERAIARFQQALDDPAFPPASRARVLLNLGKVYGQLEQYDEALRATRQAVDLVSVPSDPSYALAYYSLGTVLYEIGHKEEAIAALERVLEVQPDHAAAHLTLGLSHRDLGDDEAACAELRRVLQLAPGSALSERARAARARLSC